MRLFVAVDIDKQIKSKVLEIQHKLPSHGLKMVNPENFHFTLKFLGEQPDNKINEISSVLSDIASKYKPFIINISGVGAFPSDSSIRVLWIGSSGLEPLLLDIHKSLDQFKKEDYKPHPHLTLARVSASSPELKDIIMHLKNSEIGAMTVNSFVLKKSVLKQSSPVYEDVKRFDLP